MASRDVTTSNSDSEEFTASECSDSDVFYSDNDSEISESEDSSSAEESGENEDFEARSPWTRVYPPEDDPSGVNFVVRNPGVRNMPSPESRPSAYLFLFLTSEILDQIVRETRRYADTHIGQQAPRRRSRESCWDSFCVSDLKKFLGLTLLMGLVR